MRTLTLRRALLASASVRLHRLEDRSLASPTPGSDRRHRPCDRPHTRADRDRRSRPNRPSSCSPETRSPASLDAMASRSSRLVELNDLADPNRIYVGQRLRVGGGGSSTSGGARPSGAEDGPRRQSRVEPVGHRAPLRRDRRRDRRGQRPRQPQPHLRGPAARHPGRLRATPPRAAAGRRARSCSRTAARGVASSTSSVAGRACGHRRAATA